MPAPPEPSWHREPEPAPPPPAWPAARALRGRASTGRVAHRHETLAREPLDDGWGTLAGAWEAAAEADPGEAADGPGAREAPAHEAPVEQAAFRRAAPDEAVTDEAASPQAASPQESLPRAPARAGVPGPAEPAPSPPTVIHPVRVRRLLSPNDSPDLPFELSINPYRGCEHGCIYCYARPTHAWLDRSPGLDFETQIEAKVDAAARLQAELARPGHRPTPINIGSVTDPYQPAERRLGVTRSILEVLLACGHPFTVVTRGSAVLRDRGLLAEAAARGLAAVAVTVTTLDAGLARSLEPRAASPAARLKAVEALAAAGVPVALNAAPLIPFVNEPEIERLAEAAAAHGAVALHHTVLRLPWEVEPLFRAWLARHLPGRAERVLARVREMQGGRLQGTGFGSRMRGEGAWADLVAQRVAQAAARHGLALHLPPLRRDAFVPPAAPARARAAVPDSGQASLF